MDAGISRNHDHRFRMNTTPTTRAARAALFQINSPEADSLRRELFAIAAQDAPLPAEYIDRYNQIIRPK